jgi:hypothetical protein
MAQVEAQCLPFGQGGCKNEKQESKSKLLQYQIFYVNLQEGTPKRLSRVAYNYLEE